MGCYGIGVSRTVAASIEQNHDENGIIFPLPLAPFQAIILNLDPKTEEISIAAETFYRQLQQEGLEVLLDDRDERPGVKFKDADLLGIPLRVNVGARGLKEQAFELQERRSGGLELRPHQVLLAQRGHRPGHQAGDLLLQAGGVGFGGQDELRGLDEGSTDDFDPHKMDGGGGDDLMFGGSGADVMEGGDGNDMIFGGNGDDTLTGHWGDDFIHGGDGRDNINGGSGANTCMAGEVVNRCEGTGKARVRFEAEPVRRETSGLTTIQQR